MKTPRSIDDIMKEMNDLARAQGRYLGKAFWEIAPQPGSILDFPKTPESQKRITRLRARRLSREQRVDCPIGGDSISPTTTTSLRAPIHNEATEKRPGGSAASGGFAFQYSLGAWVACGVLAERAVSPRWGLASTVFYTYLRCEAEQFVDDLMIGTSQGGVIFIQATLRVELSRDVNSKLASVLNQFVRQFHAYPSRRYEHQWERPLNSATDRLVLATDDDAPRWLKTSLPALLEKFRSDSTLPTLESAANSKGEKKIAGIIEHHIRRVWEEVRHRAPTKEELRNFLSILQFDHFDLGPNGRDRLAAMETLRQTILRDPTSDANAFLLLEKYCENLATTRTGGNRAEIEDFFRRQPSSILIREPLSFRDDICRLQQQSDALVKTLDDLATIKVLGGTVKIERGAVTALRKAVEVDPGHYLVVGEPGAGKSGVVHDMANQLLACGRDLVFLAADRLPAESARQLQSELELDHGLVDVLRNWPGQETAYLIIDALDSARSEAAGKCLRDLVADTINLHSRWRVIVSVREFDSGTHWTSRNCSLVRPLPRPCQTRSFQDDDTYMFAD